MGVYFFDKRVFDYIRKTPPSALRSEVEITDVIQNMIDAGERIAPVWFKGKYINVTYPEDIRKAEEVFAGAK
jgi:dTDP-glucose pyrophosphorylase